MRNARKGFTLIELIITVLLFSIIIGTAAFAFSIILRAWSSSQIRSDLREDAALAIEKMTRQLNDAREITSSQDKSVSFWWQDTNGNGVRDSAEVVTYSWDGTQGNPLKRGDVTIAFNIKNFQISYRNLNNSALSPSPDLSLVARDSIRRLDIKLILTKSDEEITLITSVVPRNLSQVRGPW